MRRRETVLDPPPEEIEIDLKDSILNSTKKQLGLLPDQKDFDDEILMHINSAIFHLRQIGVGSQDELFIVNDESQTYADYLGEDSNEIPAVRMYMYYKTRLGFDPPQSSIVMEATKSILDELEWRLHVQVDPPYTFGEGGEISK